MAHISPVSCELPVYPTFVTDYCHPLGPTKSYTAHHKTAAFISTIIYLGSWSNSLTTWVVNFFTSLLHLFKGARKRFFSRIFLEGEKISPVTLQVYFRMYLKCIIFFLYETINYCKIISLFHKHFATAVSNRREKCGS